MVDVTSDEPTARASRRSRILSSVMVGLLGVVAVAILITNNDGAASPVSVANAFMEARDNLDAEAALALFAADVPISDGFIEELSQYPVYFEWLRTSNWRWTVGECAETSTGEGGTLVRCDYISENDWTRALSQAPVSGFIEILVTDGEITGLVHTGEIAQFDDVWDLVTDWVVENHPDTVDQSLTPDLRRPILDANSVTLWSSTPTRSWPPLRVELSYRPHVRGPWDQQGNPPVALTSQCPDGLDGHSKEPRDLTCQPGIDTCDEDWHP